MQVGFVLASDDLAKVLCLTGDRENVRLVPVQSTMDLNRSICLSDLTEMKNVYQRLKDSGLVGDLEIVNVARLYKRFY
jgi:hypothetical protein